MYVCKQTGFASSCNAIWKELVYWFLVPQFNLQHFSDNQLCYKGISTRVSVKTFYLLVFYSTQTPHGWHAH